MKKIVCILGSTQSGKTTVGLKLALALEKRGAGRVAFVTVDPFAPMLSVLFPGCKAEELHSLGGVVADGTVSGEALLRSLYSRRDHPNLGVAGYLFGESPHNYPTFTEKMCQQYFDALEEYVDWIIVDGSTQVDEPMTQSAYRLADTHVILCTGTLSSQSYLKTMEVYEKGENIHPGNRIYVLNQPDVEIPYPLFEAERDGVKIRVRLPHEVKLKKQLAEGRLWDKVSSKKWNTAMACLREAVMT